MRYIANDNGYLLEVSFGAMIECNGRGCTEYIGVVPAGYDSLADWFTQEGDQLHRWHIVEDDLILDVNAPEPEVYVPPEPDPTISMTLLWENDDPTSTFTAKTMTVDNIADYDLVRIVFELVAGGSAWDFYVFENYNGNSGKCAATATFYDGGVYVASRAHTINWRNNSISFEDAKQNGSTRNDRMVPYKIYGVKGVIQNTI